MKKLSGVNWKKALLSHGEKIAFGVVALAGVAALGMSRWAPYSEKNPGVLIDQAQKAEQAQKTSTWPEAEQAKFADTENIYAKAQSLLAGIDESRLEFSRTLDTIFDPVIPPKQPVDEPKWLPVRQLIASSGYLLYEKAVAYDESLIGPDGTPLEPGLNGVEEPATPDDGLGDDFRPAQPPAGLGEEGVPGLPGYSGGPLGAGMRGGAGGTRGGGAAGGRGGASGGRGGASGGRGGASGGRGGAGSSGSPVPGMAGGGRGGAGIGGYEGAMPGMAGEEGMYGMLGAGTPVEGVAKRYVAVRGVVPLKAQEEELARARSQSRPEVAGLLTYTDFELERQKAVAGPDPWAGEWQKVDIQVANDVLQDQARFDYDPVDPTVTNAVFTMPLPGRVMGDWQTNGTHPALTQYNESEEAKQRAEKLQQMIADYAAELERQQKELPQFGGFAGQQWDVGQVGRMMVQDEGYMNSMPGMMNQPGPNGEQGLNLTKDDIKALITAGGTYVLFRYLDFDVQPGNAYRYRVRLKLINPNANMAADQVARHDVAEGQYRWTEWSEPTPATVVPEDTRHYLASIEPGGTRQPDRARFELFQWSTETGAFVSEFLSIEPGQFIAGTQPAEVLDVAGQTFESKDFTFTSDDMLVDIDRSPPGLASVRPELNLGRRFEVPAQVLIVNDSGQLEVQDPYTDAAPRVAAEKQQERMADAYAYLQEAAAPTGEETGLPGEYGSMMEAMMGGGGRGGGDGGNPLRRGRRNRGRMPAMGEEGMMPGGAAGGRGGGSPPPRRGR